MKRRNFIALLSGAAAWPLAARAQQGEQMWHIGVVVGGTATDRSDLAAFQQVLPQLGWIDGRNVRIDYRFGLGNAAEIRRHAAELARSHPTSSWPLAPRSWRHCCRRLAPCRLCS